MLPTSLIRSGHGQLGPNCRPGGNGRESNFSMAKKAGGDGPGHPPWLGQTIRRKKHPSSAAAKPKARQVCAAAVGSATATHPLAIGTFLGRRKTALSRGRRNNRFLGQRNGEGEDEWAWPANGWGKRQKKPANGFGEKRVLDVPFL